MKITFQIAILALAWHLLIIGCVWFIFTGSVSTNIMDWEPAGRFWYLLVQAFCVGLSWFQINS